MNLGTIELLYFKPTSYALLLIKGVHEVTGLINKAEKDHDTSKNDKSRDGLASSKAEARGLHLGKKKTGLSASEMLLDAALHDLNPGILYSSPYMSKKSMVLVNQMRDHQNDKELFCEVEKLEKYVMSVKGRIHKIAAEISEG
jgi:hypothetical protein